MKPSQLLSRCLSQVVRVPRVVGFGWSPGYEVRRQVWAWACVALACGIGPVRGQQPLQNLPAATREMQLRPIHPEEEAYTLRAGDFRLLVTPSLELDYNDNVTLSRHDTVQDFILRPLLELDGTYPVSQLNMLRFNVGVGYDWYLRHDEFSALRLVSGSELSFDASVKDFLFNVHDRFQYIQDPAEQASVANTGRYGGLDNTAGLSGTWNLRDVKLTLGYDHQNFVSSSSEFSYLNRATEMVVGRAGFQVTPALDTGVEAGGSFTRYEQDFLNNGQGLSAGAFAGWRPSDFIRVEARGGYTAFFFEQTSRAIRAANQDGIYASLTVSHDITKAIRYSVAVGHELRLGTSADLIEDYYVRPSVDWYIIRDLKLTTYLSYEHGKQGEGELGAALSETYDWVGTGLAISYPITRKLTATLRYRLTLRSSDLSEGDYTQNLVGVMVAYHFQ